MFDLIGIYRDNKEWLSLVKDIVYLSGFIYVLKSLYSWNFRRKEQQIKRDSDIRNNLEQELESYVLKRFKEGNRDIGVRFVYWKNYPYKLDNDAFNNPLRIEDEGPHVMPSGWIDKTGINFDQHLWFSGSSVYVDKFGIFFIDKKDKCHVDFEELKNPVLVFHMPFSSIIHADFKEYIEHEPVFYIRYPYTNYTKLYDDKFIVREKNGEPYYRIELSWKNKIKSPDSAIFLLKKFFRSLY